MWWKYYIFFSTTTAFFVTISGTSPDLLNVATSIINHHDSTLCGFEKFIGHPDCLSWPALPAEYTTLSSASKTPAARQTETPSPIPELQSRFGEIPEQAPPATSKVIQFNGPTNRAYLVEQTYRAQQEQSYPQENYSKQQEQGNSQQRYRAQQQQSYPQQHYPTEQQKDNPQQRYVARPQQAYQPMMVENSSQRVQQTYQPLTVENSPQRPQLIYQPHTVEISPQRVQQTYQPQTVENSPPRAQQAHQQPQQSLSNERITVQYISPEERQKLLQEYYYRQQQQLQEQRHKQQLVRQQQQNQFEIQQQQQLRPKSRISALAQSPQASQYSPQTIPAPVQIARVPSQTQQPQISSQTTPQISPLSTQFTNGPEPIRKEFTTRLHQLITSFNPDINVIYSPISLQSSLALIYTGAAGQTAQELQQALGLPADREKVFEMFQVLAKSRQVGDFTLNTIGRLFYSQSLAINPLFRQNARQYFESDATPVNFGNPQMTASQINQWVSHNTNHRIRNLIAPQSLDARTSALLVNAIYFKAKWQNEFSTDETTNDEFFVSPNQKVAVSMMNNEDVFRYGEIPDAQAKVLQLPYKDSDISMMVILPNDLNGLNALEKRLQGFDLRSLFRLVKPETVKVQLPKFRVDFELDMVEVLKRLNIQTLFSYNAELPDIFPNQQTGIDGVKHKAFIEVNEAGSEAAAATFTKFIPLSLPSNLKQFRADHPFMFAIVSPQAVYFAGHVVRF